MLVGRLKPGREHLVLEGVGVGDVHRRRRAESVVLPAASRARAVSVCAPFGEVRVSQTARTATSCPRRRVATPSTKNCTP